MPSTKVNALRIGKLWRRSRPSESAPKRFRLPCRPVRMLGTCLVLSGLVFTACAPAQLASTPTAINSSPVTDAPLPTDMPPPTDAPGDVPTDITPMRPYTEASIWNKPIGPAPEYDPHSTEMIATIGLEGKGQITSDPSRYSYPLYFVDETT